MSFLGNRLGTGRVRPFGSFSPLSIGGLVEWLLMSDQASMGSPSDLDPISSMSDLSALGNTATQGTASSQPIWHSPNYLNFDGSNDRFNIDTVVGDVTSDTKGTWFIRFEPTGTFQNLMSFAESSTTSNRLEFANLFTGTPRCTMFAVGVGKWTFNADTEICPLGGKYSLCLVHDGVAPVLYFNGVLTPITFSVSSDKTAWFSALSGINAGRIGNRFINNTETSHGGNDVYEVAMYGTNLSASEVLKLHNYNV